MNLYLLINASKDDDQILMSRVRAKDIRDAIVKFELFPFTYPDDWDNNETFEEAFDSVCKFYNVDENTTAYDEGNSISYSLGSYVIYEISPDDKVETYPKFLTIYQEVQN